MTETDPTSPSAGDTDRPGKGNLGRYIFVALATVGLIAVIVLQRRVSEQPPSGWVAGSVKGGLEHVRKNQMRGLVVFFCVTPRDSETAFLVDETLPKANKTIRAAKVARVYLSLKDGTDSHVARRHNITTLPTLVLYDPEGNEVARLVKTIPEMTLKQGFFSKLNTVAPSTAATNPAPGR